MMATLFGASWFCLLLAGLWSLLCGYFLRRAWTAQADAENAQQLQTLRDDGSRLRGDLDNRNGQIRALEGDLGSERTRLGELQGLLAGKGEELQSVTSRMASFESKAAGFDLARLTALKTIEERDQHITKLKSEVKAAQVALIDSQAQAEARRVAAQQAAANELAGANKTWETEHQRLTDEHTRRVAQLEQTMADLDKRKASELAALTGKVSTLAAVEKQLEELTPRWAASQSALTTKDKDLQAAQQRLAALEPLAGRLGTAETELADAKRALADTEAATTGLRSDLARADSELTQARARATELEPWQAKFKQAEGELGPMRSRLAELTPWKAKYSDLEAELGRLRSRVSEGEGHKARFDGAQAELAKLRARVSELEAAQGKWASATTELGALRQRVATLEPWQAKAGQADAELAKLRARVAELEPLNARLATASAEVGTLRQRMAGLEPWQAKASQAEAELARLRARIDELQPLAGQLQPTQSRLDATTKQRDELNRQLEALRNAPPKVVEKIVEVEKIVTVPAPAAPRAVMAAAVPAPAPVSRGTGGAPAQRDDLKRIEGIGPKIEKLLNAAGYLSFRSVAQANPAALASILEKAGPRFKLARSETWPEQALLLADQRMDEFKKLTDELKGGVRR